ncbi:MAG TPA: hypothetical protein VEZ52_11480 [Desulfovibrio sp.]|uniref:hypothetical protein n=1 Tax=Desulfovibrio sp. TaxID=885 RepID=UPI002D4DA2F9|nr:hypothetical protein [Desulfovibrio sp.]HZF62228.1 hypothetical protein [Desulfovibrio sp.]
MKWLKKGKICDANSFDLSWYKKNTMVPLPYQISKDVIRVYVTFCDDMNIGRIGYVDVSANNPSEILSYSQKPLVDIGNIGCFDDNGVVTASVLRDGDILYLYYSGYQLCVKVPYLIFAGVAASHDNGNTFTKITNSVPMLDRISGECGTRCVPFVLKDNSKYKMWYTADFGSGWVKKESKLMPLYDMKYCESFSPVNWANVPVSTSVSFKNDDEHGIAKCTVWQEDGLFKTIYSIRSLSNGYRLGYGESTDGHSFERKDELIGIDVSPSGWDSEMIAFAERIECNGKVYLFYCGNHYGLAGMGYAELLEK